MKVEGYDWVIYLCSMLLTDTLSSQILFLACVFYTYALLLRVLLSAGLHRRTRILSAFVLFDWILLQGLLSWNGIYSNYPQAMPPYLLLFAVFPCVLVILVLMLSPVGRRFQNSLSQDALVLIHTVRIPVEFGLYLLYRHQLVPQLMTFEGRNFDILAGLSALLMFGLLRTHRLNRMLLIGWNVIGLVLLLNIVVHGLLSAPSPIQQLAFDQPNVALLHFPYALLPAFIVPVVLWAHLSSLRLAFRQGDPQHTLT